MLSSEVLANWVGKCTNGKCKEEWAHTERNNHSCKRSWRGVFLFLLASCQASEMSFALYGYVFLPHLTSLINVQLLKSARDTQFITQLNNMVAWFSSDSLLSVCLTLFFYADLSKCRKKNLYMPISKFHCGVKCKKDTIVCKLVIFLFSLKKYKDNISNVQMQNLKI